MYRELNSTVKLMFKYPIKTKFQFELGTEMILKCDNIYIMIIAL